MDNYLRFVAENDSNRLFHITGVDVRGRRFKRIATNNFFHARGINLYRGTVWEVVDGKRKRLWSVWN